MSEGDALSKFNGANASATTTSTAADNHIDHRRISHPNLGTAFSHDESEDGLLFDGGDDDDEEEDDASCDYGQNDYDTPRDTTVGDQTAAAATAIAAIAFTATTATTTATTTTPRLITTSSTADFDLCGSMWKRRGGLGRNAERKWVMRAFTLGGSRLNYHEESEFDSITYISKPRATLDLSKVETIAEMHSKQKRGLPSSDLLTINIYDPIVHAKRKWEMCCMSKEQQLLWYRAIKAYDGKPTSLSSGEKGGIGGSPHSPMEVGGGGGGTETRESTNSLPSPVLKSPGRTPSFPSLTLTPAAAAPMKSSTDAAAAAAATTKSLDDVDFIARVAAKAAEILLDEQRQNEAMTGGIINLFDATIISLAAILNFVIYIARHETLFTTVGVVNVFVIYVAHVRYKSGSSTSSSRGGTSRTGNPGHRARAARAAATSAKRGSTDTAATIDDTRQRTRQGEERDDRERSQLITTGFIDAIPSGRTIPRGFVVPDNNDLETKLRSCGASVITGIEVGPPHSYGNVDAAKFQLRIGPNYKKNKQKGSSGPALYDLLTMDFLFANTPLQSTSDKFRIPHIPGVTDVDTGHAHIPPMLIINTWLPGEEPSMFGRPIDDSSYSIPMIFVLSKSTLEQLRDITTASPGVKLLSEWCMKAETDPEFRGRFKVMGMIEDIESTNLPKLIQGYNGKPALVTKSGTFTRQNNYIEFTINVNMWAYLAKKGLFTLIPTFPDFIVNVGFTIEARCDEEMPEVLLGGCRLMNLDPEKAIVDGVDDLEI